MNRTLFPFMVALLLMAALVTAALPLRAEEQDDRGIPLLVRQHLAEKYFPGVEPMAEEIDKAVESLALPTEMIEHISKNEWEKGQLEKFATNHLFLIVRCPDNTMRAITYRDGKPRADRLIDESRYRVLKRLYSADSFNAPPAPELQKWLEIPDVDAELAFTTATQTAAKSGRTLDEETIARARKNMFAETTGTAELAIALGALSESLYDAINCWAALWLISRMDGMQFSREEREKSVPDLVSVNAREFYENVECAVRARMEFPWAVDVADSDFLHQVLSPRCTGEPQQRWRRHYFDALYPEIKDMVFADVDKARAVASHSYGDYYQYEGDTTWEDFGMLTSLAVHEGRCEDCSNVLNAMYRTIGLPACQAFTPWWGSGDGNHAWTWLRGVGDPPSDGKNGVKIYVKTWDELEDVTAEYTPVTTISGTCEVATATEVKLLVWNHEEWRSVAKKKIVEGKYEFANVGCRKYFALCVRIEGVPDAIADVSPDGTVKWFLTTDDEPQDGTAFALEFEKSCALGEFQPDEEYELFYCSGEGWKKMEITRAQTGAIAFNARPDRLYRIAGKGISDRPFNVTKKDDGEFEVTKR